MSKRAEELYDAIRNTHAPMPDHLTDADLARQGEETVRMRVALIDAELRKERERAANNVQHLIDIGILKQGCDKSKTWRAAILPDEDD